MLNCTFYVYVYVHTYMLLDNCLVSQLINNNKVLAPVYDLIFI